MRLLLLLLFISSAITNDILILTFDKGVGQNIEVYSNEPSIEQLYQEKLRNSEHTIIMLELIYDEEGIHYDTKLHAKTDPKLCFHSKIHENIYVYESFNGKEVYCTEIIEYSGYHSDTLDKVEKYEQNNSDAIFIGEVTTLIKQIDFNYFSDKISTELLENAYLTF